MRLVSELTDAAVMNELGARLARYRIEAELTQAQLAEKAGVSKRTVEHVEAGHDVEFVTLIRLLRVLGLLEGLERLVPEPSPSPLEQLKLRGKQRQRVAHSRRGRVGKEPTTPPKPWTWKES